MSRLIALLLLAALAGPAAAGPVASATDTDWQSRFRMAPNAPPPEPSDEDALLTDADRARMLSDVSSTLAVDNYLAGQLANRLPTPDELLDRLDAVKRMGLSGAGLTFTDLLTGVTAHQNGDQWFSPASVIKLAVMVAAFGEAREKRVSLDTPVVVRAGNVTGTWLPPGDRRPMLYAGRRIRVRDLLDLMISRSDNIATNCLIDTLGAAAINRWMRKLGFPRTQVHHKLGVGGPSLDTGSGVRNGMTPNETARILAAIYRLALIDEDASRQMLALLGRQMDRSKIPAMLPAGTRVYNKTGETSIARHDAGIVEYKGHPYVLVVFTRGNPDRQIAALARMFHQLLVR